MSYFGRVEIGAHIPSLEKWSSWGKCDTRGQGLYIESRDGRGALTRVSRCLVFVIFGCSARK